MLGNKEKRVLVRMLALLLSWVMLEGCRSQIMIERDKQMSHIWTISNGQVQLKVDQQLGRIVFYGFVGGRNVLWVNSEAKNPAYILGGWKNWGGEKIWVWPQEYWNWPPPEPQAGYQVGKSDDGKSLVMTSAPLPTVGVRIVRQITLAPTGSEVVLTTHLEPVDVKDPRPIAAWSITQVAQPKQLLARIPNPTNRHRYLSRTPGDGVDAVSIADRLVELKRADGFDSSKTFLDADLFAAVYDDVVFLQKQVAVQQEGAWKPDGRGQIYYHLRNPHNIPPTLPTYIEVEWTAPLLLPQHVAKAPLRNVWSLVEKDKAGDDVQLQKMLESIATE